MTENKKPPMFDPPPDSVTPRGGADAVDHSKTLTSATAPKGEDTWAQLEREREALANQRIAEADAERRYVAALDARSVAQLAQARSATMESAATVGVGGLAGLLLLGPVGAVAGVVGGWLFDKFNEPWGM